MHGPIWGLMTWVLGFSEHPMVLDRARQTGILTQFGRGLENWSITKMWAKSHRFSKLTVAAPD